MKDPIRRAVSLRCRTDRAIERLCKARSHFERGRIAPSELFKECSDAVQRATMLEVPKSSPLSRSINRKVYDYRTFAQETAALAAGFKSRRAFRTAALKQAEFALRLQDRSAARFAHELLWVATGGLFTESELNAFERCETL